jgi:hypothetical protein
MTDSQEATLRIRQSSNNANQFDLVLDHRKPGDYTIRDEEGRELLLVGPEAARFLQDQQLDYQDRDRSGHFVVLFKPIQK